MTTTIVADLENVAAVKHVGHLIFRSGVPLRAGASSKIVTEYLHTVKPVNGVVTVELVPGPAIVQFGGTDYPFIVPEDTGTNVPLWPLIEQYVEVPPDTPDQKLDAAVGRYIAENPLPGVGLDQPAVDARVVTVGDGRFAPKALPGVVKSVNGTAPDGAGNVATGGGGGQADTVDTLGGTGAAGRSVMKAADAAAIRGLIDAVTPAQVSAAVAALVDSSPATLDTLKELAGALGNDPNFAATIAWQIGAKYTKPASGIPLADLVAAVQTSLGKADTASQSGHKHAAADLTATGTLDATTFLRGDNTWAVPSGGGAANVELAYAEVATKIPLGATSAFEDAPGLAITFAPGSRPAMVDAYLATVAAFNSATWGFRVVRTSDNRVMAEGVCNTTSAVGYPPSPQLRFRVAAGAASATYKVQTCMWEGTAPGELNAQAEAGSGHRAYISAVSV